MTLATAQARYDNAAPEEDTDATASIRSMVGTVPCDVVYRDDGAYIPDLVTVEFSEGSADPQDFSATQQRQWEREITAERNRRNQ